MTANFNRAVQPPPVVANKIAMPVGTSIIMSMDKFLFDKRDQNCKACRNGYRSTLPKMVGNKVVSVGIICTCVPYCQQVDADGTGIVVYKGRRENWVRGVRPDSEIQDELVREGKANISQRDKANPKEPLKNPNGKNAKANVEKALQNENKPKQRVMQQDKNGHWLFVDLETGKKMGLSISDVANPIVNPDNPDAVPQAPPPPPPPQSKAKPESDEEFLLRTTGQAPMAGDPTLITEAEANKIEAERGKVPVAPPPASGPSVPAASAPAPTNQPPEVVKRPRGRPKGSGRKKE